MLAIVFKIIGFTIVFAIAATLISILVIAIVSAISAARRVPMTYILGNLKARKVSLGLSVLGIGVVIAVMLSMTALDHGVTLATQSSASKNVLIIMREGAEAEISSSVTRDATQIIRTLPGIAKDSHGQPLVSPEQTMIFKLPREGAPKGSNVIVRGVSPSAFEIRPYVKVVEGQMFRPTSNEMIVSKRIGKRFNLHTGDSFTFGTQTWKIVGAFTANDTAYDSEIWADLTYLGQVRKRDQFSSVLVKPVDQNAAAAIKTRIANDNRLKLQVRSEYQYYTDQMNGLMGIKILVGIVAFFMTFGAILGTMSTMFSAIASRQRELATLRALGFNRRTIIGAVVIESAIVAILGAAAGLLLSLPVNGISTGTTNWSTFSELAFSFRVDGVVAANGFIVALVAGIYGGSIPAIRAMWKPITTALREI